jgi:hypothetical protein
MSEFTASTPASLFRYPVLTPLTPDSPPTAATIKLLRQELLENAMAIPSLLGGGQHGFLGILIPAAAYLTLTGSVFVAPAQPTPHPVHGADDTGPRMAENTRLHASEVKDFIRYRETIQALRKCILVAVPTIYTDALRHDIYGHATTTPLALLTHLDETYGKVLPEHLNQNFQAMNAPWTTDRPIEQLWTQIRIAQQFAALYDPITDQTAIRSALTNLQKCGGFQTALDTWFVRPTAEHTLANLKDHFNTANTNRLRSVSAQQAGYHATDRGLPRPAPAPPSLTAATVASPTGVISDEAGKKWYYCWTHGMGQNATHTSATCENRADGHRANATLSKPFHGSRVILGSTGRATPGPRPPRRAPPPA